MNTRRIPAHGAALLLLLSLAAACRDHPTAPLLREEGARGSHFSLAVPPYHEIDLGTLGGNSWANAINEAGHVVGSSRHAFLWTPEGGMQDLGTLPGLPGDGSRASDINDAGTVVGSSGFSGPGWRVRAVSRSSGGEWQDLGAPAGMNNSQATAINNKGEVVGEAWAQDPPACSWFDCVVRAFLYRPGFGMVRLDPPNPSPTVRTAAYDINDSSRIVGKVYSYWDLEGGAFVMQYPGKMQIFAAGAVTAWAINNAGQVVGWDENGYPRRPFVWTAAGGTQYLPLPPGRETESAVAMDIDERGRIVGYGDGPLLWTPNGTGGYVVTLLGHRGSAVSLNGAGQVVGYVWGDDARAVMWSPGPQVPPARPADLAARASLLAVDLTWVDASNNEASFEVRRATRLGDGTFGPYETLATIPVNRKAYADPTAVARATYRYQVSACNSAGCTPSLPAEFSVPEVPAPPSAVQATLSVGLANLAWDDASTTETLFQVQRSVRNQGSFPPHQTIATLPASTTAFADTTVAAGVTYSYRVRACNVGCAASDTVVLAVPALTSPAVVARVVSATRTELHWAAAGSHVRFQVLRSTRLWDGRFSQYGLLGTGLQATTFTDSTGVAGAVHAYVVEACFAKACVRSAPVTVSMPLRPAPPVDLTATIVAARRVNLAWTDASTNESSYPPFLAIGTVGAGATAFSDATVAGGNTYRYRVQACRNTTCTTSASVPVTVRAP